MPDTHVLVDVIILLAAGVVMVAVFRGLKLGAILGYLIAGALIGPFGFGLITATEIIALLGEFGVVFLLFIIGLELPLDRIRVMRGTIFGLGLAQLVVTTVLLSGVGLALGYDALTSVVAAAALSLSSTAIVLSLLAERGKLPTRMGRSVFGVLLMQDLAVGPLLALIVAFSAGEAGLAEALGLAFLRMIAAVAFILVVGRWLLVRLFHAVGLLHDQDVFAGFTLLVLLSTAMLTEMGGLSLAFGAFLAGMLLAETPFRHQVAAEIQPFRGLLLGLFFMSVGMGIDTDLVIKRSTDIALLVACLMGLKGLVLFVLGRLSRLSTVEAIETGTYLAQGGEFAFVLLAAAGTAGLVPPEISQVVSVGVAVSMLLTPLAVSGMARMVAAWEQASAAGVDIVESEVDDLAHHTVIIGAGRVGRTIATQLRDAGKAYVSLDMDPHAIARARQEGLHVYYGDATRPEVLFAVGLDRARALVIAIDDPGKAIQMVNVVKYILPDLPVYARARDAEHAVEMEKAGAASTVPEVIPTANRLVDLVMKPD